MKRVAKTRVRRGVFDQGARLEKLFGRVMELEAQEVLIRTLTGVAMKQSAEVSAGYPALGANLAECAHTLKMLRDMLATALKSSEGQAIHFVPGSSHAGELQSHAFKQSLTQGRAISTAALTCLEQLFEDRLQCLWRKHPPSMPRRQLTPAQESQRA